MYRQFRIILGLCISSLAMAGEMGVSGEAWYKHIAFGAAGGPNWLNTPNTTLTIAPGAVDRVVVDGVQNDGAWRAGLGYALFEAYLASRTYLNRAWLELNVYQISGSVYGRVHQFQIPQFENYSYQAPFISTRLMLELKPQLFTYQSLSPYLVFGVGAAWNRLAYTEQIIGAGTPEQSHLILASHVSAQLAGNLGAGLSYAPGEHFTFTGEYIYGFMGNAAPGNLPANNVRLQHPPRFSLQTQSLLLGVRYSV